MRAAFEEVGLARRAVVDAQERARELVAAATQDAEAVARFADRIVVLRDGQVSLSGTTEEVFSQVEALDAWRLPGRIG